MKTARYQYAVHILTHSHGWIDPRHIEFDHEPSRDELNQTAKTTMERLYGSDLDECKVSTINGVVTDRPICV